MRQSLLSEITRGTIATRGHGQPVEENTTVSIMVSSSKSLSASVQQNMNTRCHVEDMVEKYDPYICAAARQKIRNMQPHISAQLQEEQINELVQRSRIKFWLALKRRPIRSPKAYIRRIVHSEAVDMVRQKPRAIPLTLDEEGELYQGWLLVEKSEGMNDPAIEAEQLETTDHYISSVVSAAMQLSPRQQEAMICWLKERLGDSKHFTEVCKNWNIDPSSITWPDRIDERRKLKACVSPARKNVRALITGQARGM
jgi:DNA-directed RNA polymerase specialized sigma24 family protein